MATRRAVLVAEDNENDAYILQRAFTKAGINPLLNFVRNGEEAIQYLKGEDTFNDRSVHPLPEVLLLDLKMPRLDGFEVLQWIRKQPGLKRLIVVVLTTSDLLRDVNKAYDLGANSFLTKPQDVQKLSDLTRQIHEYWLEINQSPEL